MPYTPAGGGKMLCKNALCKCMYFCSIPTIIMTENYLRSKVWKHFEYVTRDGNIVNATALGGVCFDSCTWIVQRHNSSRTVTLPLQQTWSLLLTLQTKCMSDSQTVSETFLIGIVVAVSKDFRTFRNQKLDKHAHFDRCAEVRQQTGVVLLAQAIFSLRTIVCFYVSRKNCLKVSVITPIWKINTSRPFLIKTDFKCGHSHSLTSPV